jgi:hypothetical protein
MEYKDFKKPLVVGKLKNVKFSRIVADEFNVESDESVEHRPARDQHIDKIYHSYSGVDVPITIALNSRDNKYHLVDGQHRWFNIKKLIRNGLKEEPYRMPCIVLYWEGTNKKLDISISKNRDIAKDVSFCANEGNERTCVIDKINHVWKIAQKYVDKNGMNGKKLPDGIIDYVLSQWRGYEKLSERVIRNYISYGRNLYENKLLTKASYERWKIQRIIDELDIASGKIKTPTYPITIFVSKKELQNDKDIKKLRFNYIHWDKHLIEQITGKKHELHEYE